MLSYSISWSQTSNKLTYLLTYHGLSCDSATVRFLSLRSVWGIGYRQNWNSCARRKQHSSITWRHYYSTRHTLYTSRWQWYAPSGKCRKHTPADAAVTVTVTRFQFVLDHPIVNSYFRYQSSNRVLDKKLDRVLTS